MNITIYNLVDNGVSPKEATRLFQALARYIKPHSVMIHRPVVLKGKNTITTITLRAFKLEELDKLCEDRLLNPRRSLLQNWIDIKRVVNMLKVKNEQARIT